MQLSKNAGLSKNDIITLEVSGYSSEGYGIARHDGIAVFVKQALRGEMVQARILKVLKNAAYAKIENIITPSAERVTPDCPHYPKCGGCALRHMSYAEELRFKRQRVSDALSRIGGVDIDIPEVVPSPLETRYRNKAIFEVGIANGKAVTGFFRERTHEIIPVDDCLLQTIPANTAARVLRGFMDEYGAPNIRNLFVRSGENAAQIVVVAASKVKHADALVSALKKQIPNATSIIECINREDTNVVLKGEFKTLFGVPYFEDTLCGGDFRLSPQAFYQINRAQAENLYNRAVKFAALEPDQTALDLYCGAGTITLALAKTGAKIYGAEIVPEAIENAKENAYRSGITNAEFLCGDAAAAAETFARRGIKPDAVVVDPPRKGLSPETAAAVAALAPKRIVYVSCDPATLARDIKLFAQSGYRCERVQPFDMFPRTPHVECAALLVIQGE